MNKSVYNIVTVQQLRVLIFILFWTRTQWSDKIKHILAVVEKNIFIIDPNSSILQNF